MTRNDSTEAGRPRRDRHRPRVLLPVRVLEGEGVSPGLIQLLAGADVVLLGYHVIPEQTAPAQARLSFEERASGKLDEIEAALVEVGARVDRTLAFTPDAEQTVERVATEEGCVAIAYVNPVMACDRVLVVLHGDVDAVRLGTVTAGLVASRGVHVGVVEIVGDDERPNRTGRTVDALEVGGVDRALIHEMVVRTEAPVRDLTILSDDFDATVLGERAPTLRELLFGEFDERVIAESLGPVVVVRREEDAEE